jgi:microcystin-dependent protein
MAAHVHPVSGNNSTPNTSALLNNTWATQTGNAYGNSPNATMNGSALGMTGGGQAHINMQPYLTINFCIALQGIFPSQN